MGVSLLFRTRQDNLRKIITRDGFMNSAAKPRILFVHDEDNILKGIERMLRSKRGE